MKTITGTLTELGQGRGARFLYIEIDGQMIKDVRTFEGLDGKLRLQLGERVTLHMDGHWLVALTTAEGKTFSSEPVSVFYKLLSYGLILVGIPLSMFLLGIPIVFYFGYLMYVAVKIDRGAALPNAIQIPRA